MTHGPLKVNRIVYHEVSESATELQANPVRQHRGVTSSGEEAGRPLRRGFGQFLGRVLFAAEFRGVAFAQDGMVALRITFAA